MAIALDLLKKTCKEMIETILLTLSQAIKGTIYRVGPVPDLHTARVASGVRTEAIEELEWGLDESSDYAWPGKSWLQYRDEPGRLLEAMSWCVEKQKSWTADNPHEDQRSIRKQLSGDIEDFHHMEPVLVRKRDYYGDAHFGIEYPLNWQGNPIWTDSEFVVVAVIKIHFLPHTIKRGDLSTRIIKKLSRTLGTELLSLGIRQSLAEARQQLDRQRLQTCNILAHELRNTFIKLGFVSSAINAEISFLREQWEAEVEKALPDNQKRKTIFARLDELVKNGLSRLNGDAGLVGLSKQLLQEQAELANLALMPPMREKWLNDKIRPKWHRLLNECEIWNGYAEEIGALLSQLEKGIWFGVDEDLPGEVNHIPKDLRDKWRKLAYRDLTLDKFLNLDEHLQLLDHPELSMPHKQQSKKVLTSLKVLAEMIPEMEDKANRIIANLRNGSAQEADQLPALAI
jgi:hypothetical protein